MKTLLFTAAALFGALVSTAQQPTDSATKLKAELSAQQSVVTPGKPVRLTLRVEVTATTKVPATLLSGLDIQTYLDGEKSTMLDEVREGMVEMAAGSVLTRQIEISSDDTWSGVDLASHSRVSFEWQSLPSARVTLRVVPDQADLDLDQLDLKQTKVRLITSKGDMVVRFFPDVAPNHVRNFIKLSAVGFYDGTAFHRVIPGFMIQGGCPNTKEGATGMPGTGNAGKMLDAEFSDVRHERGILSMARSSDPNSASCQFFVVHGDAKHLNGQYSAFGMLESGLDVLDAIANVPVVPSPGGPPTQPQTPVWIYAAVVEPVFKG